MFKCKKCLKIGKKCEDCKNYEIKKSIEDEILKSYLSQLPEDQMKIVIEDILEKEGLEPI
ncbi:hypothetical protein GX618_03485 [Candidatus Dojkabacteria bacterium]|uniref:Uncharacterized protein n=1 Tax=Candidatus Dojkabacteria bacterium TaxID=2099670 RepID=A0A847EUG3_9BACT|nr:hypothetical protein [Candidatus Dojkabacteria bacterium]